MVPKGRRLLALMFRPAEARVNLAGVNLYKSKVDGLEHLFERGPRPRDWTSLG